MLLRGVQESQARDAGRSSSQPVGVECAQPDLGAGLRIEREAMLPLAPDSSPLLRRLDRLTSAAFAVFHRMLTAAVALALVILALIALWNTAVTIAQSLSTRDLGAAIAHGVDTVFLTIILLELLHTVITREPLAKQAQDFIVIGLTSAVRFGLSVVATASSSADATHAPHLPVHLAGTLPRDTVINLAINSASVLLLVCALWLVRHRFPGDLPEDDASLSVAQ